MNYFERIDAEYQQAGNKTREIAQKMYFGRRGNLIYHLL
jgi:hypothetical protein